MAKCLHCGKNTLIRGHVSLFEGAVCTPCFKKLGFKLTDTAGASSYYYDDIKDGKDHLSLNIAKRQQKHKEWLDEHPDVVEFMDALSDEDDEIEEDDKIDDF